MFCFFNILHIRSFDEPLFFLIVPRGRSDYTAAIKMPPPLNFPHVATVSGKYMFLYALNYQE